MPSLPFSASPSPSPHSSPSLSPTMTPSIVLHSPASGGVAPKKELHKSKEDAAEAYRLRYAQYLASTFSMSIQAALSEADAQLAPRRSSSISEAESYREF
ncbi:hypothetical protein FB567DRAFT_449514 [Paraphoma chrysanthemicola]|uniref:Uncharacterized protein n=1 Tax=Paraphoma chrysanthemicola TaxID=798071 RepID=A0A8K0QZ89_9PLEO|nr:hypothetical protein BKA63DRAFT_419392 [Paraphoma chrysanthemicola]KAH7079630.1 hypothetical protein FB567DRAFT_449514 [Paraphoma chrysanthemicola]